MNRENSFVMFIDDVIGDHIVDRAYYCFSPVCLGKIQMLRVMSPCV